MVSRELSFIKFDYQNEFDCLFFQDQAHLGTWEHGFNMIGMPNYDEFEPLPLAYQMSHTSHIELNDFEEICGDLGLWDFEIPTIHNDQTIIINNNNNIGNPNSNAAKNMTPQHHETQFTNPKRKSSSLQLEKIKKYFDVPISKAAKELNVGVTVLKKRCRELNIMRWPHRKIKSLESLIHNVKEMGLTKEIEMLEEYKRMVEKEPKMEFTKKIKKLRQACFKANYKKRMSLQLDALA